MVCFANMLSGDPCRYTRQHSAERYGVEPLKGRRTLRAGPMRAQSAKLASRVESDTTPYYLMLQ